MNIGIMTHCVASNDGANLQALSTGDWLKRHGYTPVYFLWNAYLEDEVKLVLPEQLEIHRNFLKKQGYIVSKPCRSDSDFLDVIKEYNIENILVGSDCVLTYYPCKFPYILTRKGIIKRKVAEDWKFPNPFWLPFLKGNKLVKRFMISASGGSTEYKQIDESTRKQMRDLLSEFDFISVRDHIALNMVNSLFGKENEPLLTADPVFGFDDLSIQIPSEEEIRNKFNLPEKYFVVSFFAHYWPSNKWCNELCFETNKYGIKCLSVPVPSGGYQPELDQKIDLPLDPIDWYCLIKYSSGYIGNKMHPLIVCLRNVVPFFSFNVTGRFFLRGRIQDVRYGKVYDLLKRFDLEEFQIPQKHNSKAKPDYVVNKLFEFNLEQRRYIADLMKDSHENMMQIVSSNFTNNKR